MGNACTSDPRTQGDEVSLDAKQERKVPLLHFYSSFRLLQRRWPKPTQEMLLLNLPIVLTTTNQTNKRSSRSKPTPVVALLVVM